MNFSYFGEFIFRERWERVNDDNDHNVFIYYLWKYIWSFVGEAWRNVSWVVISTTSLIKSYLVVSRWGIMTDNYLGVQNLEGFHSLYIWMRKWHFLRVSGEKGFKMSLENETTWSNKLALVNLEGFHSLYNHSVENFNVSMTA